MFQKIIKLIGISTALLSGLLVIGSLVTGFRFETLRNNLESPDRLCECFAEDEVVKPSNTEGPLSQMMQLNFP